MDNIFSKDELLLRAVRPDDIYWKPDGSLSSAAFKDKHGLSVDRTGGRTFDDSLAFIRKNKSGTIVYISVSDCESVQAVLLYRPEPDNFFHSEIHRDENRIELSKGQCRKLASLAQIAI